jgi:outer membrane protein assembly factor BamB
MILRGLLVFIVSFSTWGVLSSSADGASAQGWLGWRGPGQNGVAESIALPDKLSIKESLKWRVALSGGGTPIISNDRVYVFGYRGEGADLQEVLVALDVSSGKILWERGFNDFLSDIIYERYSIGSPAVDAETGNIYLMTSSGLLVAFNSDGEPLFEHSMMEAFGRLTFPNGRTGSPIVVDDLVIVRGITTSWGSLGPARDRFYAFHKKSGDLVWISTPGVRPIDSSFSTPVVGHYGFRKVLYAGTGCGNLVCFDARTGQALWRYQMSQGGVNASILVHDEYIIAVHGKENLDSSKIGRMVAIDAKGKMPSQGSVSPVVLDRSHEAWRADLSSFTSSGVLFKDRVYQVTMTGDLVALDADLGKEIWRVKLGSEQLHASPLIASGKIYVPMRDGKLHVVRDLGDKAKVLETLELEGSCLGAPAAFNGQLFVQTTKALYAFGSPGELETDGGSLLPEIVPRRSMIPQHVGLRVEPTEVSLMAGAVRTFKVWVIDEDGYSHTVLGKPLWFFSREDVGIKHEGEGRVVVSPTVSLRAGVAEVRYKHLTGHVRYRTFSKLPYGENFDGFTLKAHPKHEGVKYADPPLAWIGAKLKWEVRVVDGNRVLRKTLDRLLFQRATTFIGHPDMKNYVMQADVMSEGNRRAMSTVGVVNQRYIIALKGNWQQLEVSSNFDRIQVGVPFKWAPNTWYTIKSQVDVSPDGTGVVRAKAWPRGGEEPKEWLIEVPHKRAHQNGSPGIFGFSPQAQHPVYVDNIMVRPKE